MRNQAPQVLEDIAPVVDEVRDAELAAVDLLLLSLATEAEGALAAANTRPA